MKKTLCLLVFLTLSSKSSFALEEAKFLEVSSSKKSVILDRGTIEGIKIGSKAKIYVPDLQDPNKPNYTYIAEGEAIKVHSGYSYWFLRKVDNFRLIKPNQIIVIARQGVDTRRKHKLRQTRVIVPPKKSVRNFLNSQKDNIPEEMIYEDGEYFASKDLVGTSPTKKHDIETRNYGKFNKNATEWSDEFDETVDVLNPDSINKVIDGKVVRADEEGKVFESSTTGSVNKINNLRYGRTGLYEHTQRGRDNTLINTPGQSYAEEVRAREKERNIISPRALNKIKRDGPGWSGSMSDAQLRRFFVNSGIARELKRQKRAIGEKSGHEVNLRYSMGLTNHTTSEDENHQSNDYAISLGYEFHLGATTPNLEKFTLELELERGISHYDMGGANARLEEGTVRGYFYWYFWNPPTVISKYMLYGGIGFRKGNATGTSSSFSKSYSFQVTSIPSARFGIKYRFKAGDTREDIVKLGFGINLMVTSETTQLTVIDTLEDDINGSIQNEQLKFSLGMNIYF